jgi:hypothetical protein
MKNKTFKSKFSDLKAEVYETGYIVITDAEGKAITLGKPYNDRIDLILDAINYVLTEGKK